MSPSFPQRFRTEAREERKGEVIGAGIEVHRIMGPGLLESIYEKSLMHELELRGLSCINQKEVRIEYKGMIFVETLKFDILVEGCLLVELKAVQEMHHLFCPSFPFLLSFATFCSIGNSHL